MRRHAMQINRSRSDDLDDRRHGGVFHDALEGCGDAAGGHVNRCVNGVGIEPSLEAGDG
jgi:hypothetical protein